MEGVVDSLMRRVLTGLGGIDVCVTEFLRVSENLLPPHSFYRVCPELHQSSVTESKVPVVLQLLGSDPRLLAENAFRAAELGAKTIDLNFGCPAKTVNRHRGGAVLLDEPELIHQIVSEIRSVLPASVNLTAKMRLGNLDKSRAVENAIAIAEGGASALAVHARTKVEGYRPPAHWEWIAILRERVSINVIANGEVWTVEDYHRCRDISGCQDVMIGRGLIARPDLALAIKKDLAGEPYQSNSWDQFLLTLQVYMDGIDPKYLHGRVKQWLKFLMKTYPEAEQAFLKIRKVSEGAEVRALLQE